MTELMVIGFEGKHRAAEVLEQLETLNAKWTIDLKDAVAVYRTEHGKLRVVGSVQATTREGALSGAVVGGLLGALLAAPFTAGVSAAAAAAAIGASSITMGVAGAAIGGFDAEDFKELSGISDDFVKEVGGMVQPGQSAVFALARVSDPEMVAEKFRGYGGKVLRTTLAPEAAGKFEQIMASQVTR